MESIATSLALLACPVGMGLMMWFMMRGAKQPRKRAGAPDELLVLRAEHARLQSEVERLRETDGPATSGAVASER